MLGFWFRGSLHFLSANPSSRRFRDMVVEVEKKEIEHRRRTGQKMTQLEIDALIAEIKKTLSAEEGAAYEALNTVIED